MDIGLQAFYLFSSFTPIKKYAKNFAHKKSVLTAKGLTLTIKTPLS